ATMLSIAAQPAHAERAFVDPIVTPVSAFAIDVPSSLLVAATTGVSVNGITSGQLAAMLANSARFDSDWISTTVGRAMGGSTTPTPPDIADLSAAERAQFDAMVSDFGGAPATKLAGFTKVVGGKAIPIVGAVLAGVQLGAGADRALGVDVDGGLCAGGPNFGFQAADAVLAALTSADCDAWNLSQEQQAARNQDTMPTVTGTAIGSTSCLGANCASITSLARVGSGADYEYCIVWNVPSPNNAVPLGQFSNANQSWYGGADYKSTALTEPDGPYWNLVTVCPAPPAGSFASLISAQIGGTQWQYPLTSWKVTQSSAATIGTVTPPTLTYPDPSRTIRCDITLSTGQVLSASTPAFHEADANLPRPVYPAIPDGAVPTNTQCVETGGPQSLTLSQATTTSPYRSWRTNDKECGNGSCLTDLRQNGASCFFGAADCDGWMTDPNRDTTYQCYIGTHAVAITECYIYGTTFNAANRASGHAYADPSDGTKTTDQTSPSLIDEVTDHVLKDGFIAGAAYTTVADEDKLTYARAIAVACLALVGKPVLAEGQPGELPIVELGQEACLHGRIYAPGSDVKDARDHDLDAILGGQPSVLHYVSGTDKAAGIDGVVAGVPAGWYNRVLYQECGGSANFGDPGTECDEYPYYTSAEGGPGASLRTISEVDNGKEGTQLSRFYSVCGLVSRGTALQSQFAVVPIPDPLESVGVCAQP
ncbi:MAG: NucA/NucB deoxyribonuclease domain-containing protein, partial [Pseudolysinimonas sp.]